MAKIGLKDSFLQPQRTNPKRRRTSRIKRSRIKFGDSFTLMVVPNSQKKILNFKINTLSISFVALVLILMVFSFFFLNTSLSVSKQELKTTNQNLISTQANLSLVLDTVSKLGKAYDDYKQSIVEISDNLGLEYREDEINDIYSDSDLASIGYLEELADSEYLPQVQEMNILMNSLSKTIKPIQEASEKILSQKQTLTDIPSYWPVAGSNRVSMEFGPNTHPITAQQYLHKGIDIPGTIGLPVLASANGKVIKVTYDTTNYGIHIIIEHKYGIKTKYAHLSSVNVEVGDIVRQGDTIGKLGSTGTSTGPHLHFEIMIGNQIQDPSVFLRIQKDFTRSNY